VIRLELDGTLSLERLFDTLGVSDFEAVLELPANKPLVNRIAKECALNPVGTVYVPESEVSSETLKPRTTNAFQSSDNQTVLELIVVDPLQNPQAHIDYELVLPHETGRGKTDGSGQLKQPIPEHTQTVVLVTHNAQNQECVRVIDIVEQLAPIDTRTGLRQRLEQRGHFIHPEIWANEEVYPTIDEQAVAYLQANSSQSQTA